MLHRSVLHLNFTKPAEYQVPTCLHGILYYVFFFINYEFIIDTVTGTNNIYTYKFMFILQKNKKL